MKLTIGMPLIHLMEYVENRRMIHSYKERILAYCKTELEIGDGKISNEIELAVLTAWLKNSDEVKMPNVFDNCTLVYSKSYKDKGNMKSLEEYQHKNGSYYVKLSTINPEGRIIKTQLTHRLESLEELIKHGGVEDILIDSNGDCVADSRLINKTVYNELDTKESNIYCDINIDGKLD